MDPCLCIPKHRRPCTSRMLRVVLLLLVAAQMLSCGTKRAPVSEQNLLQLREQYKQNYLDETNERYTALLKRNKQHLDEYRAGKRPNPPTIDYLVISGGGDVGAFGAGVLNGWSKVPKTDPLARPRSHIVTGVSTGALTAPF